MKKVFFINLDAYNYELAIDQMWEIYSKHKYPNGAIWEERNSICDDLVNGFNPNEYFSFYVNAFDVVETKIG